MANDYGLNVWRLDTAGVVTTDEVVVKKVIFKPNDTGDDVVLKDSAGHVCYESMNALAATPIGDTSEEWLSGLNMKGFNLSTLSSSAVLFVYLKK